MEITDDKIGLDWLRKKMALLEMQIAEQTAQLEQTKTQREIVYKTIQSLFGKSKAKQENIAQSEKASTNEKVILAAIELIHRVQNAVTSGEIMTYLENSKKIDLSASKARKHAVLAAILSYEVGKKDSRLVRVNRGVYNVKK